MTAVASPEQRASGSSFYTAMRLLPPPERRAIFAVYGFCRDVDDVADSGDLTRVERLRRLNAWREDLRALYAGAAPARTRHLAEHVERFRLPLEDFLTIVDGVEMDVVETIRAPAYEKLDLYCERVATAVGRLSVRIFGMEDEPGRALAHHLGRALQLTNILRDLDEDAEMGRLYVPAEALAQTGITSHDPAIVVADPDIDQACRWLAAFAHEHYEEAEQLMRSRPAGKLRTPRLMNAVYSQILTRMESVGWRPPRTRPRVGKARLMWAVLRHGLIE
jgi:phytoene synthase